MKRLLRYARWDADAVVFSQPVISMARLLHWFNWRRHAQATARGSHYRRRSSDEPTG
ncbi:hypothetical protein [Streptomyces sp. NPDC002133]|uniref:hypothetical protein n=1 Tax=Streptomyces sp. NPDC002133 TaxID=3154409 RepID=UPI00333327D4